MFPDSSLNFSESLYHFVFYLLYAYLKDIAPITFRLQATKVSIQRKRLTIIASLFFQCIFFLFCNHVRFIGFQPFAVFTMLVALQRYEFTYARTYIAIVPNTEPMLLARGVRCSSHLKVKSKRRRLYPPRFMFCDDGKIRASRKKCFCSRKGVL